MEVISRKEAKARGLKRYFTGKLCKRGHMVERHASSGNCVECKKAESKAYWAANKEKLTAQKKVYREANKESIAAKSKAWYEANRERVAAKKKAWLEANPEYHKAYYEANLVKYAAARAKRKAAKLQRTMSWADREAIKGFYDEARILTELTGVPHHVDHIIPLQGKLVSGLHVENNLQILTAAENLSKRNNFEPCIQLLA